MPQSASRPPESRQPASPDVLSAARLRERLNALPNWAASADGTAIVRKIRMQNFLQALAWFGRIAEVAEADNHHPDLHLVGYRHVTVELSTHSLGGVTDQDLTMAAKIDAIALP